MVKLNVYDKKGKAAGEVVIDSIPDGFVPNKVLIARSLKRQLANARIPAAHVKNRAIIHGGGRKPFRQKGLGRSRQGSIRAIQWVGGAVAFGPQRNRNFTIGMNRKERTAALRHLIWSKIMDEAWLLFSDLDIKEPSTKVGRKWIDSLGRTGKLLLLIPAGEEFETIRKSLRNLPEVSILTPDRLNTFDLLNNDTIIAHESAFETIRATWQV